MRFIDLSGDISDIRGYHRYLGISQILGDITDIRGYHRYQGISQISGDISGIRRYYRTISIGISRNQFFFKF